jgi:hypothetical protein
MVAVDLGTAITAAIYVETIYGLPGLGHAAVQALTGDGGYDLPIVVGLVLSIAIAVTVLNTAADLAIAKLDPRVRLSAGKGLLRPPARVAGWARASHAVWRLVLSPYRSSRPSRPAWAELRHFWHVLCT